jgi:hypothetical protein
MEPPMNPPPWMHSSTRSPAASFGITHIAGTPSAPVSM